MQEQHWLNYLRVMAILAVLAIHVSAPVYYDYGNIPDFDWWIANVINAVSRFCVPMFVMISGALLLGRETNTIDFYKKRGLRLLPAIIVWSALFAIFTILTHPEVLDYGLFSYLVGIVLEGKAYYHLWYLSMFACLMLFAPFLNLFVIGKRPDGQDIFILFLIFCLFFLMQQASMTAEYVPDISRDFQWFREFPMYIAYFVMGYYLKEYKDRIRLSRTSLLLCLAALMILGIFENYYLALQYNIIKDNLALANESLSVFLITSCIFLIFAKSQHVLKENKLIAMIASCSFGIYLIHPIFLHFMRKAMYPFINNPTIYMLVALALLFLLSFATIFMLRQVRPFRYIS